MITYINQCQGITPKQLVGFFVNWPNPPSPQTHLKILQNSQHIVLAINSDNNQVVGFVTAISDGILSAYIPLLEVLPNYQKQGIGKQLMKKMLANLADLYMIDLICDQNIVPFYLPFKMRQATGMVLRNYEHQSGKQ